MSGSLSGSVACGVVAEELADGGARRSRVVVKDDGGMVHWRPGSLVHVDREQLYSATAVVVLDQDLDAVAAAHLGRGSASRGSAQPLAGRSSFCPRPGMRRST